ncbi:arsenate reductase family protein [Psychroserpens sp. Hel_I_66]|uniref:arsenate reductase family protein n=1 Tax=Psychroserpens sp. Hel_I_66 TaxID=1250004 RepID=UPI0006472EE6|nr:ArsC/Spx/MgsR family protein [Psychroserpens sp. Hel_I_66]
MKTFFYLKSCSTCNRIIKELDLPSDIELHDIKSSPISEEQINHLKELAGSFEALFSKRAQLYKSENLKDKNLNEEDFKFYLLKHYTFLKRPVLVYNSHIFIGNSSKTVEAAKAFIQKNE